VRGNSVALTENEMLSSLLVPPDRGTSSARSSCCRQRATKAFPRTLAPPKALRDVPRSAPRRLGGCWWQCL